MTTIPRKRSYEPDMFDRNRTQLSPGFIIYKPSDGLHILVCNPEALPSLPDPCSLVLLASNVECGIIGKFSLIHLAGPTINILGASLKPDPTHTWTMFSPNSHAFLTMSQTHSDLNASIMDGMASFSYLFPATFSELISSAVTESTSQLRSTPSVILLHPLRCRITDAIIKVKRFKTLYSSSGGVLTAQEAEILGFDFVCNSIPHVFRVSPSMKQLSQTYIDCSSSLLSTNVESDSVNSTARSPILLVAGPKSVGKSSLVRFIVNSFLTNSTRTGALNKETCIAVLDCDIGQPEFTTCGMVSLTLVRRPVFGPPFSHQILLDPRPMRQCFVGCTTPSENPQFYLDCLEYVYDAYRQLPTPRPPLVVNTMGWTQGLGLTLLVEQILMVRPNIIAQLQLNSHQPNSRLNLPILDAQTLRSMQSWNMKDLSKEEFNHQVVVLPSMSTTSAQHPQAPAAHFGAPDHRDLTLLAYFTATLANSPTSLPARGPTDSLGHPIAHFLDCLPHRIPLMPPHLTTVDGFRGGSIADGSVPDEPMNVEEEASLAVCLMRPKVNLFMKETFCPTSFTVDTILECLNATLVALSAVPPEMIEKSTNSRSCALIPANPVCECFGLGICRAIDLSAGILYLTTGVPVDELVKVTGILRGSVNLPQFFFLEQPIHDPPAGNIEPVILPYLGPLETQGLGRTSLPARRSYPRTLHHEYHRTGSSEMFERT